MQKSVHQGAAEGAFHRGPRQPDGGARHIRLRGRSSLSADHEAVIELQRLAGNAAVARSLIGQNQGGKIIAGVDMIKVDQHPSDPPDGLQSIRKLKKGAGILGYTVRMIEDRPPILKSEAPSQTERGWTAKARAVSHLPEPEFDEYWPTKGRHMLGEAVAVDVDGTWENKLHKGEDEHVDDTTLAWSQTWKLVADIINRLAKAPGAPQATAEAAREDLFARYRSALPQPDLQPDGSQPNEDDQRKVLAPEDGTLFWWMYQTTVVRDTRGYHTPKMVNSELTGNVTANRPEDGDSKIPGPKSADLLKEVRKKFTKGAKIKGT